MGRRSPRLNRDAGGSGHRQIGKQITVPGSVDQIAAGAGGVWLLDGDAGTVSRIDPKARTVDAPIGIIGSGASSITAAFGAVWVTVPADRDIVRIDPLTADVQRIAVNAAGIWSAPDTRTGWLWLVVEPPADVGTGFGYRAELASCPWSTRRRHDRQDLGNCSCHGYRSASCARPPPH